MPHSTGNSFALDVFEQLCAMDTDDALKAAREIYAQYYCRCCHDCRETAKAMRRLIKDAEERRQ